jgi:hypothetical protein
MHVEVPVNSARGLGYRTICQLLARCNQQASAGHFLAISYNANAWRLDSMKVRAVELGRPSIFDVASIGNIVPSE